MKRQNTQLALIIVILALVAGIGYAVIARMDMLSPTASTGKLVRDTGDTISDYSAVFLTNGQVYFGKMYSPVNGSVDLRDIYYLQVNQQIQPDPKSTATPASSSQNPSVVLVKLGDELHGPNDRMLINSSQVLFTESLKKDGKVVGAINDHKAGKK
jgi:hypothetical protein